MNQAQILGAKTRYRLARAALQRRVGLLRGHFALQSDRSVYLSLAALEQRRRSLSNDSGALTRYELRCFSQNGEDGILAEILDRVGCEGEFFVEFGIQDGREGNCVLLADVEDWTGVFIEADPIAYGRLELKYRGVARVTTLNAFVSPENIEQLFGDASVPEEFDVLSIDIDGQDYWIWEALRQYRPRIVVVEYNSALPSTERWVSPKGHPDAWDGSDYMGSSLAAFEDLAARKGYVLVHTDLTALNAFFVRNDLVEERFPSGNDVPRRLTPNYNLAGVSFLPDPLGRGYVDLRQEPS